MEIIRCRIRENSGLARIAAWKLNSSRVAIVFGRVIHLYGVSREVFLAETDWVRHEVRHVRQYREHGFWGFLWLYVIDWMRNGYQEKRIERAARQAESNMQELDGVEII